MAAGGALVLARLIAHWPPSLPMPPLPRDALLGGAAAAAALGLLLMLWPRRRGAAQADDRIAADELRRRGLHVTRVGSDWVAEGRWRGEEVAVQLRRDHHAGRFGRPWVLVVRLPGRPRVAWPFMPEQASIAERDADGFAVVVADVARVGSERAIAQRVDELFAAREPAPAR